MLGDGMGQAGFVAAADKYVLENNISRLKEDHPNCKKLSETLQFQS